MFGPILLEAAMQGRVIVLLTTVGKSLSWTSFYFHDDFSSKRC